MRTRSTPPRAWPPSAATTRSAAITPARTTPAPTGAGASTRTASSAPSASPPRSDPMTPAVYEGTISHARRAVRRYGFRHRIALAYVDVGDVPRRLTRRRPGLPRFRPEDYLG